MPDDELQALLKRSRATVAEMERLSKVAKALAEEAQKALLKAETKGAGGKINLPKHKK